MHNVPRRTLPRTKLTMIIGVVMIFILYLLVELNVRHITKTEQNKTIELESRGMI